MDLTVLIGNIDRLKRDLSDHALSKKAKCEDAVRNLRRYASGELKGTWTLETLEKVANALGVASWELLRPPTAAPPSEMDIEEIIDRKLDERFPPQKSVKKRKIR